MIDTTALLGQPIVINVSEGVLAMSLTALQEPAGTIMIEISRPPGGSPRRLFFTACVSPKSAL
jgi:hypothetical protein